MNSLEDFRRQVPPAQDPDADAVERGRVALTERIAAEPAAGGNVKTIEKRVRRRTRGLRARRAVARRPIAWAAAAAIAATTVLGSGVAYTVDAQTAHAAAVETLERSAEIRFLADAPLEPGQYRRVHVTAINTTLGRDADGEDLAWLHREERAIYQPAEAGDDWYFFRTGASLEGFFTEEDQQRYEENAEHDNNYASSGPDEIAHGPDRSFYGPSGDNFQNPSQEFLDSLPRDPEALVQLFYAELGDRDFTRDEYAFTMASDLLRGGVYLDADLREAVFGALARLDGIRVSDQNVDVDGEPAVGVSMKSAIGSISFERRELLFSKETGALLGERDVWLLPVFSPYPAGATTGMSTYSYSIVDRLPATVDEALAD